MRLTYASQIRALASRKSVKRLRIRKNVEKGLTQQPSTISPEERDEVEQASLHEFESAAHENKESSVKNAETKKDYVTIASRGTVLQACTTTSGLISALGFLIRQVCLSSIRTNLCFACFVSDSIC